MANTGKKIVVTLKEVYVVSGVATGQTKNNVIGEPDYIPPYTDTVTCPIVNTLVCPVVIASGRPDISSMLEYEFSLLSSILENPNVAKVKLYFKLGGVTQDTATIIKTAASFYKSSVMGLPDGVYTIDAEYLNSGDVVQATCAGVQYSTITVS